MLRVYKPPAGPRTSEHKVLDALARVRPDGMTREELSLDTGLPRSTLDRALLSLTSLGAVVRCGFTRKNLRGGDSPAFALPPPERPKLAIFRPDPEEGSDTTRDKPTDLRRTTVPP